MKSFRNILLTLFLFGFMLLQGIPVLASNALPLNEGPQLLLKGRTYHSPVLGGNDFDTNYFCSNPAVLKVSPQGVLSPLRTGKVDVMIASQGKLSIHSYEIVGITPATCSIKVGEQASFRLKASAASAGHMKGHWSSSAPSVASVNAYGQVKALSPGNAEIAYTFADGTMVSSDVCVFSNVAQGIPDIYLKTGGQKKLHFPQFAKAAPSSLRWTSSSEKIASVLKNGVVTGEQTGNATIICSMGTEQYSCRIHVISLEKNMILAANDTCEIGIDGLGQASGNQEETVHWSSSDTSVVSINEHGAEAKLYAGKNAGNTIITAEVGGQKLTCKVSVINLSDQVLFMQPKDQYHIRTEGVEAGTPIRWSSSNTAVASVDAHGLVTAKHAGSAVISCKASIKTRTSQSQGLSVIINVIDATGSGNKCDFSFITEDGSERTYHLYKQNAHTYGSYSRYMSYHGCATCSVTTILNGYSAELKDADPVDIITGIEKEVAGADAWTKEHETKELRSQMPLSLYGMSAILTQAGIPNTYVRKYQERAAIEDITAHLKTGNPIIFEVRQKSKVTGQSSKRWTNSYHTMALLGIFTNGKVLVCDSVDRSWYKGGQRLKITELSDIMEYMFSCSDNKKTIYYSGHRSDGGYIKIH